VSFFLLHFSIMNGENSRIKLKNGRKEKMKCPTIVELNEYIDQKTDNKELQEHISQCSHCESIVRELTLFQEILQKESNHLLNLLPKSDQQCLSDAQITDFINENLSESEQSDVIRHLSTCPECLNVMMMSRQAMEEYDYNSFFSDINLETIADKVKNKIEEIKFQLSETGIKILELSQGFLFQFQTPELVPVRGTSNESVIINRQINQYEIKCLLKSIQKRQCSISIIVNDSNLNELVEGMKIKIQDPDKTDYELFTQDGEINFKIDQKGCFNVSFWDQEKKIEQFNFVNQ